MCLHQPTQKDQADDVPHDAQRHLAQVAPPRLPSLSKPSLERPRLPSSQLGCVPAPCRADRFLQNFFTLLLLHLFLSFPQRPKLQILRPRAVVGPLGVRGRPL